MRFLSRIKDSLREWGDRSTFGSRVFQFCRSVVAHLLLVLPDPNGSTINTLVCGSISTSHGALMKKSGGLNSTTAIRC